jgi:Autographiviridae terminase large subunit
MIRVRTQRDYELTRITKDKGALVNDERLDAVAIGVHYWTRQMARDAKTEENKYKEGMIEVSGVREARYRSFPKT